VFPVVVGGKILIPPGTYVSGSVTKVKQTGRVKGRGELYLRFEQLILPNGTIRDLTGRVGSLDGRSPEDFDREEGRIKAESNKGEDTRTVAETTAAGTSIGAIAGAAGGRTGLGLGVGAAAGAAAGLIGVLASRGPEAILEKGTQLDMVLDRDLEFSEEEATFSDALRGPQRGDTGPGPDPNRNKRTTRGLGRYPF
jgi:type IV secretion system protein VirB10